MLNKPEHVSCLTAKFMSRRCSDFSDFCFEQHCADALRFKKKIKFLRFDDSLKVVDVQGRTLLTYQ